MGIAVPQGPQHRHWSSHHSIAGIVASQTSQHHTGIATAQALQHHTQTLHRYRNTGIATPDWHRHQRHHSSTTGITGITTSHDHHSTTSNTESQGHDNISTGSTTGWHCRLSVTFISCMHLRLPTHLKVSHAERSGALGRRGAVRGAHRWGERRRAA